MQYKFKYSNVDLARYLEGRRFVANSHREAARETILKAEAIEEECLHLEMNLLPVEQEAENGDS